MKTNEMQLSNSIFILMAFSLTLACQQKSKAASQSAADQAAEQVISEKPPVHSEITPASLENLVRSLNGDIDAVQMQEIYRQIADTLRAQSIANLRDFFNQHSDILQMLSTSVRQSRQDAVGLAAINQLPEALSQVIEIIDSIQEIIEDLIEQMPYVIGSVECGVLSVNNPNLGDHCAEVARIAECVKANCKEPNEIVMCSADPTMPICGLNSAAVCGVEPGACIPRGKTAEDVNQKLIETYLKELRQNQQLR